MKADWQTRLAQAIRIATAPPIMAAVTVLVLHRHFPEEYALSALIFLALAPVLAYPVWYILPKLREGGRRTQRGLAVAFSVCGYLAGALWCGLVTGRYGELKIYLIYLASGLLIALFSYVLGIRGSGHASSVAGPVAVMIARLGPWFTVGLGVVAAVFWSSVKLKRHTLGQMLLGSLFPVAAAMAFGVIPTPWLG